MNIKTPGQEVKPSLGPTLLLFALSQCWSSQGLICDGGGGVYGLSILITETV